jgi:hypothetical protein
MMPSLRQGLTLKQYWLFRIIGSENLTVEVPDSRSWNIDAASSKSTYSALNQLSSIYIYRHMV